jgi:hypothetical protein
MPVTDNVLREWSEVFTHVGRNAEFVKRPVKNHPFVKVQESGSVFADAPDIVRDNKNGYPTRLVQVAQ